MPVRLIPFVSALHWLVLHSGSSHPEFFCLQPRQSLSDAGMFQFLIYLKYDYKRKDYSILLSSCVCR